MPVKGWVREWFLLDKPADAVNWTAGNATKGYLPVDVNDPAYRLTAREGMFAARRLVPRADWQFGRVVDGRHVADPQFVTLKGGFAPGFTYELAFESQNPPVAGVGFAAVRDMASAMKYQPGVIAPGRLAYMYGSSQTGRAIRQIVYDGFTIDEQGRKVFDAAFIKTGGASLARFNERFALVNSLGVFTETQFPSSTRSRPIRSPAGAMAWARVSRPASSRRSSPSTPGPSTGTRAGSGRCATPRWTARPICPTRPTCASTTSPGRGTAQARCRRATAAASSRATRSTTPGPSAG